MSCGRPLRLGTVVFVALACGPGLGPGSHATAQATDAAPGNPPPDDVAPTRCDDAEEAYRAGRLADAWNAAEECAATDPAAADAARLILARAAIRSGRPAEAPAILAQIAGPDRKYVPGYTALARIVASDASGTVEAAPETERRDAAAALEAMTLMPDDEPLETLRWGLLVRLDRSLGLRAPMVRHASELLALPIPARERTAIVAEVGAILADETALTDAEIEGLHAAVRLDSPLRLAVCRRRVDLAIGAGDLDTARAVLDEVAAAGAPPEWLAEVRAGIDEVASADPGRIGALLPLTGPSAAVGARALAALEIAAQDAPAAFLVEARDTASDVETTRAAVRSLATESRVVAIVGPIEARVAAAAAEEAAAAGVPMIALNVQRGVASPASCVFRDFPTYDAEVEALVAFALGHARGRRFAAARAEGRYGEIVGGLLADAVERQGGEVVKIQTYPPDRTEFLDDARALRRATPDAILFADAGARVALLAPALAYDDLWPQAAPHDAASARPSAPRREAMYLLTSVAADPAAVAQAPRYLEGAVVAVGFLPTPAGGERGAFERRFAAAAGAEATQLDAFAYDSVAVIASVVSAGAGNRPAVCRALDAVETAPTVAPFAGFGPDGEATRPIRLAVVRDGALAPLEPAQ